MPRRAPSVRAVATAVALAAALGWAAHARGEGFSGSVEPSYTATETSSTDQAGAKHDGNGWTLEQKYRLAFDRQLYPLLRLSADGLYDWALGHQLADGTASDLDARRWIGNGRLTGGSETLSYGLAYTRSERSATVTTAGTETRAPTLDSQGLTLTTSWRPQDLPAWQLLLGRTWGWDAERRFADTTIDSAQLTGTYAPAPFDVLYGFRLDHPVDHLRGVETTAIKQNARVAYSESFLQRRLPVYASYAASVITSTTSVAGTGGTVATLRTPTAGLSAVETFPDTPLRITLAQNPALIDGNTTASAGLDLGFSRSLAGDVRNRHMGAQLADVITPVNTVYVWVDRPLPPEIVSAMTAAGAWTAYTSDDNLNWTQIPVVGPVVFGIFDNRFEITITETSARYFKIVTRPLAGAVTTDERYASIVVTELQLLSVVSAQSVKGRKTDANGQLNASARYTIDPATSFAYDTSVSINHSFEGKRPTYALLNGIGAAPRLNRITTLGARAEWSDADFGTGREDTLRWGGTVSVDPIPTLGGSVGYSGQWRHSSAGIAFSNSATGAVRADLYEGITLGANASFGTGQVETGQRTTTASAAATTTLVPHRTLTLAGSYGYTRSARTGAGLPALTNTSQNLEGTTSWSPVPALYASGGLARIITNGIGVTTGNIAAGVSPFPGAALQLRFRYAETFDTSTHLRTRAYGPSARWTILKSLYVDVSYSLTESRSSAEDSKSNVFFARLFWAVR